MHRHIGDLLAAGRFGDILHRPQTVYGIVFENNEITIRRSCANVFLIANHPGGNPAFDLLFDLA